MKIEDAIKRYEFWAEDDRIDALIRKEHRQIADWLKELKSDRPTGKWIPKLSSEDKVRRYECSMCGYVHIKHPYTVEFFCPNCGAKMEV